MKWMWIRILIFLACAMLLIWLSTRKKNGPDKTVNRIEIVGDRSADLKELLVDVLKARGYRVNVVSGDDINGESTLIEGQYAVLMTLSVKVRGRNFSYQAFTTKDERKSVEDLMLDVVLEFIETLDHYQKPVYPDPVPRLGGDGSVFYMKFPRSHVAPGGEFTCGRIYYDCAQLEHVSA